MLISVRQRIGAVPAFHTLVASDAGDVVAVEHRVEASCALFVEVRQQRHGHTAQGDDSDQVDNHHEAGEHVGKGPDQRDGAKRTTEHTQSDQHAEGRENALGAGQVFDVGFAIVVVTDDRAEGEEENDDGQKVHAPCADAIGQCSLGEVDATGFF